MAFEAPCCLPDLAHGSSRGGLTPTDNLRFADALVGTGSYIAQFGRVFSRLFLDPACQEGVVLFPLCLALRAGAGQEMPKEVKCSSPILFNMFAHVRIPIGLPAGPATNLPRSVRIFCCGLVQTTLRDVGETLRDL